MTLEVDLFFLNLVKTKLLRVTEDGKVFNTKTYRYIGTIGSGSYPKISYADYSSGIKIIKNMQIHRLVWLVFRGLILPEFQLNHKDLNKNNPALNNLEIVTAKENMQHFIKNTKPNLGKHGTLYTYQKLKCRCNDCKNANNEVMRKYKKK